MNINRSALTVLFLILLLIALLYLDTFISTLFRARVAFWLEQRFLYVPSYCHEYLWYVRVLLCTALQESYSILVGEFLSFLVTYLSLALWHVTLIAHNQFACLLWLGLVELFHPVFKTLESFPIIDCIYQQDTGSSLIISLGDSLEPFLSSGIPDLHLDLDIIDINGLDFEIYSNCCDMCHLVLFISVTQENVSFADCWIPDDNYLHKVVVFLLLATFGHFEIDFLNYPISYFLYLLYSCFYTQTLFLIIFLFTYLIFLFNSKLLLFLNKI